MHIMANIASEIKTTISSGLAVSAIALLGIVHLVGITGLHSEQYRAIFESVVWINMLLSFVVVAAMYRSWPGVHMIYISIALAVGMTSEIIGVQRGWLFGDYFYEGIEGPCILGVPLVIGLNWVLLSICTGTLVAALFHHAWARVLFATLLMVGIDVLLERFAIAHRLWVWERGGVPPLMNYATWAAVALVLQCLYVALWRDQGNKVAVVYLMVLTVFLLADRFFDHSSIHIGACDGPHHLISFDHAVNRMV